MSFKADLRFRIERAVLVVAGGAAVWALRSFDLRAMAGTLDGSAWLGVALLFLLSTLLAIAPSWLFLRRAGHRIPFASFSGIMLASQAMNATNPLRVGFPFRVYLLKERYGVSLGTGSLLIPLEGFMALVVALGAALLFAPLHDQVLDGPWSTLLVLAALLGLTAAVVAGRLAGQGRLPVSPRLPQRIRGALKSVGESLSHVTPASLFAFAIFYLASDVAVAGILKVAVSGSGFDVSLSYLVSAYCGAYLLGSISLMPQGLGTRDASLGLFLHAAGASPEQAAYAALVVRAATTGFSFVLGILAAWAMGLSRRSPVLRDPALPLETLEPGAGTLTRAPRHQGSEARQ